MKRTTTKLMIAAATLAIVAGGAPARTTANDRPTFDYKTMADIPSAATHEQQLDEKARTFEKSDVLDVLSRKPSDKPAILVAPGPCSGAACRSYSSTWQQFQLYISLPVFYWL